MRDYEVVFIIKPIEEDKIEATIVKFETLLKNAGAEIGKIDRWGKKRLEYEISKFREGYYCLFDFKASAAAVKEMDRVMKITDEILKHMTIRKDD